MISKAPNQFHMVRFKTDAGTLNRHQGHSFESPPCGAVFIQDVYDVDMYQFINSPPSMKKNHQL